MRPIALRALGSTGYLSATTFGMGLGQPASATLGSALGAILAWSWARFKGAAGPAAEACVAAALQPPAQPCPTPPPSPECPAGSPAILVALGVLGALAVAFGLAVLYQCLARPPPPAALNLAPLAPLPAELGSALPLVPAPAFEALPPGALRHLSVDASWFN